MKIFNPPNMPNMPLELLDSRLFQKRMLLWLSVWKFSILSINSSW